MARNANKPPLDGDLSNTIELTSYSLTAYAAPYTGQDYAKMYRFFTYNYETMLDLEGTT
jgi:hypothetical protein